MIVELILFFSLAFILLLYTNRKPSYLPPGDWGWPIIGMIPGRRLYYVALLKKYKEKYGGGMFCSNIGSRLVLFITDFEILKKAYAMPEFCGRPDIFTLKTFGDFLGVSMAQGKMWHVNRRFAIKNLRDFGMGKSQMEQYITEEVLYLIEDFNSNLGKPRKIDFCANVAMFNLAWQLCASTRFDTKDKEILYFTELNAENFSILHETYIRFLDFYPWANNLPKYIVDNVFGAKQLVANKEKFKEYIMKYIDKHRETFDKSNPRDLIDMYFIEQEAATDEELSFMHNKRNLVNILLNFFNGSEASGSTFRWFINMMCKHPEIQAKAQKQIDEFVPRERRPVWDDRKNLSYVQACIYEASRVASAIINAIPHAATEDIHFENYMIPKGTLVLGCFEEVHHDPKYWKHPHKYYPEHFLDDNGNFDASNAAFGAFSIGKRICPGKSLSDMSLFTFIAVSLQLFTFRPADGVKITYDSMNNSQFINYPINYDIIIEKRT